MAFSGVGLVVPSALGHGDGNGDGGGQGQAQDGPPFGRGPDGEGPPGWIRNHGGGDQPAQAAANPGPGGENGNGHGHGNGNSPSGANSPGAGNGPGPANGPGSANGPGGGPPAAGAASGVGRNGNGKGRGGGKGRGNGNGIVAAQSAAPAASASSAPPAPPSPPAVGNTTATPGPATAPAPRGNSGRNSASPRSRRGEFRQLSSVQVFSPHPGQPAGRARGVSGVSVGPASQGGALTPTLRGVPAGSGGGSNSIGAFSEVGSGSEAAGPLTGVLAPGTAALGTRGAANGQVSAQASTRGAHRRGAGPGGAPVNNPAATVIERFINVIPTGVWIALAVALAVAAAAGVAAFRSTRRVRLQAGEVAAVTTAALTDPLTGVLNRRGFLEAAERELGRAHRYGRPLALAFVDIRGLKAVNDTEGHLAGDRLLQNVTLLLRESARTHDLVGRIGGDELGVLLAEQSAAGAAAMTERVRAQVPAHRASLGLVTPWDVTVGTAAFPDDGDNFEDLLAAADRRLYEQRGINLA